MNSRLTRFDRTAALVAVVFGGLVLLTILIAQQPATAPLPSTGVRVAYLAPTRGPFNLWSMDPAQPAVAPTQLTFAPNGIFDYAISPDGRTVAFTEANDATRIADLKLLDLASGEIRPLTDCEGQDAYCTTPAWRPDGKVIAYQRTELNTALGLGPSAPRIWILDMSVEPYSTFQLFADSEVLGIEPQWSMDGNTLVFYESNSQSVMVYDFAATDPAQQVQMIPAGNGMVGSLSPDGNTLIFPEILMPEGTLPARAVLRVADLADGKLTPLTPEDEPTDDNLAMYHPDGGQVAITRAYLDEARYTRGYQVYLMDLASGDLRPAVVDAAYQHSGVTWSPTGDLLLVQRFRIQDADATTTPEIWVYVPADGTLTRVVADGFYARWMPAP